MKRHLLLLSLLFGLLAGIQAQTVTIGNEKSTYPSLPMNCYNDYSYSQSIYYQSEITAGMAIGKIAYQYTGANWSDTDIKIFMVHTAKTAFTSTTDWIPLAEMTEVFNGTVTVTPGWVEITLAKPFIYNGTDNLVIAFDENNSSSHGASDDFYSTVTSGVNRSLFYSSDWTNPDPAAPPTTGCNLGAGYANIQLFTPATGPDFNIVPSSNNYGNASVNTTKSQNFVVKNNGIGFLDIADGDITLTGTDATSFNLGTVVFPIHLATNETVAIPVNFTPTTAGAKTASLHFVDNVTKATHDIALSGMAYAQAGLPFSENFDGADFPPPLWQKLKGILTVSSTMLPNIYGWMSASFCGVAANGKSANATLFGTSSYDWLITPSINLGATPRDMVLKFDVGMTAWGDVIAPMLNGVDDKFAVVISTDNGTTWSNANTLRQYDNAPGTRFSLNRFSPTKTSVSINLSGYSGSVKIGFYIESTVKNAENDLFVDNIQLSSSSAIGENSFPLATTLDQNYPNPFNPTTSISFSNNQTGNVKLTVLNAKGETVATLINNSIVAGNHSVNFDGSKFNSGVYFYKLGTPNSTVTKKMLLVK